MRVLRVDPRNPDPLLIEDAGGMIRAGGLVAFPTETVYGLGGNALDQEAVQRIFVAKGRPSHNPLIVHCADVERARALAREWSDEAGRLASTFWPGPLTLVVPRTGVIPDAVTAGLPTVALRVPSHPVAGALLRAAGVPIAAPSANRSTELSPTRAAHVVKGLTGRIDIVLDAGDTSVGIESTVVDLSQGEPVLLRSGSIDADQLREVVGRELRLPESLDGVAPRPSPGMLDRHYAPRARLLIVPAALPGALDEAIDAATAAGKTIGALLLTLPTPAGVTIPVRMPLDPAGYARALYATLHRLDDAGCDVVLVEEVPVSPPWAGISDRLRRAAHPA